MRDRESLESAYYRAEYVVRSPQRKTIVRVGVMNHELDIILEESGYSNYAIISAHNPGSNRLSDAENTARHGRLLEELEVRRVPFWTAENLDPDAKWPDEKSVCVLGVEPEVAAEIGRTYAQAAVLIGSRGQSPSIFWLAGDGV